MCSVLVTASFTILMTILIPEIRLGGMIFEHLTRETTLQLKATQGPPRRWEVPRDSPPPAGLALRGQDLLVLTGQPSFLQVNPVKDTVSLSKRHTRCCQLLNVHTCETLCVKPEPLHVSPESWIGVCWHLGCVSGRGSFRFLCFGAYMAS